MILRSMQLFIRNYFIKATAMRCWVQVNQNLHVDGLDCSDFGTTVKGGIKVAETTGME